MEISKDKFLKLPQVPGVYIFRKNGRPIYIGKSINLKSRLNSYLLVNVGLKTRRMIDEAESVDYIKVNSELESLLLESDLIKKFKPKYNIVLKDDKHALYIAITNEDFPRVLPVRSLDTINLEIMVSFGPFPNSTNVKSILKLIRKIFPYSDHKIGMKPCLYSHLGLCNPCPNAILVNSASDDTVKKVLRLKYLQNIKHIKLVLSRKFSIVRKQLENKMNHLSKEQKYEEAVLVRDKIKMLDYITQEKTDTSEFLENPNLNEDIRYEELSTLVKLTKVNKLNRIECYDVAHISGVSATASMVVLINGEKENSEYKHFKIKQQNKQSDYDSMREIAERRIKHLDSWGRPDLIIVDGGLGQVKIFDEYFKKYKIKVVGIAKNPDRLIFVDGNKVRLKGLALNIVSRIRDEAHRFARRLHHKLMNKALLTQVKQ